MSNEFFRVSVGFAGLEVPVSRGGVPNSSSVVLPLGPGVEPLLNLRPPDRH